MPIGISKLNSLGQNKEFFLAVSHATSPRITVYSQDSSTFTKLDNPTDLPASNGWSVSWTPDGVYLAVGHETTPFLSIYKRSGNTLTKLSNPANLPPAVVYGCSFSSDGVYLATVADTGTSNFRVYKRDGDTFTSIHTTTLGASGRACSWDQSGTYLLITHRGTTDKIAVYKRDGDTFTKLTNPPSYPATQANWGSFSNDGVYLAVGSDGTPYINIWKRSGDTFTKLASPSINSSVCRSARFDPSGTYLATQSQTSPYVQFYKRIDDTFYNVSNPATLPTGDPLGIGSWTADGRYYSIAHTTTPFVTTYERMGDTFTKLANPTNLPASTGRATEFYPRGLDTTMAIESKAVTPLVISGQSYIGANDSKFGSTSLRLDGTTDYIRFITKDINIGTNDFTIEMFFIINSLNVQRHLFDFRTTASAQVSPLIIVTTGGQLIYYTNGANRILSSGGAIAINNWYHVAVSRSGTSTKMFLDGVQVGSTYTDTNNYVFTPVNIGAYGPTGSNSVLGNIDEVRISTVARYTDTFTPTTEPFTYDANTVLLLHFEDYNGSQQFINDSGQSLPEPGTRKQITVSPVGNAKISTAQSKFGSSSYSGDGTGDYINANDTRLAQYLENFTIECWIYLSQINRNSAIVDYRSSGTAQHCPLILIPSASNVLQYSTNEVVRITGTTALSAETWYHVALVRKYGVTKLYLNGTQEGSSFTDLSGFIYTNPKIGSLVGGNYSLLGYIDEFRASSGARYDGNFTPPTEPFVNDANTVLLLHFEGANNSTTFTDDNT